LTRMRERGREPRRRPDSLMRRALLALLVLSACGKPLWRSSPILPSLSDQPLPAGEPVEAGIYALLLRGEIEDSVLLAESTLVIVPDQDDPPALDPGDAHLIHRRWPDSVKAGFAEAFADYGQRAREPHPVSRLALVDPQVRFGRPSTMACTERTPECDTMACTDERTRDCAPTSTWLWLSPLGFNTDSTYSVVYMRSWCGGALCGVRSVLLFRRKPGKQWTLWNVSMLAIS
jgi:hypothetical protein